MNVLIVEDDPMVASLNQQFLEDLPQMTVVGNVRKTEEALTIMTHSSVDLMLLDVFLPEQSGIDFLNELRKKKEQIPVILITAANDVETIKQALALGAADYLVKPFTKERFLQAVLKAEEQSHILTSTQHINQQDIDELFNTSTEHQATLVNDDLPKGLSPMTLQKVLAQIELEKDVFSTEELAKKINLSRISTKKYLVFLTEQQILTQTMEYRDVGRPITLFKKV